MRWVLAGVAAQKEAIATGVPLKAFCVGGVLEDNLIYTANAVAEDVPGASVIVPVNYCAPSSWFDYGAARLTLQCGIVPIPANVLHGLADTLCYPT